MGYKVYFVNQKKEIATEGGTLAQACGAAGFPLNLVCGGKGTCGKCKVTVERNGKKEQVLACKTLVKRDEKVYLDEKDYIHKGSVLTEAMTKDVGFQPSVKKMYKTKKELTPTHSGAFLSGVALPVMQKFAALSAEYDFKGCTFVYYEDKIIDVQEGDASKLCYGAAVDIGTTTAVCYFYDLINNKLTAVKSRLNKQIIHGADVIARNVYAQEKPENLEELRRLIQETINEMLEEVQKEFPEMNNNIYHMVLCGNSTMQHLFYGLNPANLGASPFANITAEQIVSSGKETGLRCAEKGVVEFLPLLGGFVGADTAAVLLTLEKDNKKYLAVDLGTNGEIAVGNHDGFLVASTACGPALEGGNIDCGMRGTEGAIEKISLKNGEVQLKVIGNTEPKGICGSGIIDAVAELKRAGLIDESGRLLSAVEYEKNHPGSDFCRRLKEVEEYNLGFYFTAGDHPVYLSQKDIRQIQLAKSSIYSGCMTLLTEYGAVLEEIDALVLAGAFGNYIDIDNALSIGLLPPVAREKIISVGNGAGQGVQSLLLDKSFREKLEGIPKKTVHVELADHPDFMELYISNMNFH